jgi:poly(hydroxyalkanoate) depolymerase family esterase
MIGSRFGDPMFNMLYPSEDASFVMRSFVDSFTQFSSFYQNSGPAEKTDDLIRLEDFGTNPGELYASMFVPDGLPAKAPLVVLLHGCTQSPASYGRASGWKALAARHGFALLLPKQRRRNNPLCCFNWFQEDDIQREGGETLSIAQMIDAACDRHSLDKGRVYVSGLSAGGAMTAVLLATYPELFAGGGIIAGLPYAAAANMDEAFDRMRGRGLPDALVSSGRVRDASQYAKRRPSISVWQGASDDIVSPSALDHIVDQWLPLLGAVTKEAATPQGVNYRHERWLRRDKSLALEAILVSGMGHGVPLDLGVPDPIGEAGPYMLDMGLSSTLWLARSWKLAPAD